MKDMSKSDFALGKEIHKLLVKEGIETPMVRGTQNLSEANYKLIEEHIQAIMVALGLDMADDSLVETPKRIAKMYLNEVFWGLNYAYFPKITTIENKMQYSNMLVERHIKVNSLCEHHFMPFVGEAFVAYIPSTKVIGLSKINRLVEFFSRRPQVQERLTEQVFFALSYVLETDNVAVVIKADHTCVRVRGVENTNADTVTSRLGGCFLENFNLRNELFNILHID